MTIIQSLLGLAIFIAIAWMMSEQRHLVRPRIIIAGVGIQFILALLLLKIPIIHDVFTPLSEVVAAVQKATQAGSSFIFGYLGGGDTPYDLTHPQNSFILAFQALPLILVMSALSALLFHWRILPPIIHAFSWLLRKSLGIGGALGLSSAANILVGMIEAPLLIRPYLASLTRSELFAVMVGGMATIAGTVMVFYASILGGVIPDAMGHILTASLISAPAALMLARIMIPEDSKQTQHQSKHITEYESSMDAITQGTLNGLQLLLNIVAMLLVLVALVHLSNQILALLPSVGESPLSLERILGWIMAPFMWLIGIPWAEAQSAGELMGIKTVLNELLAYLKMATLPEGVLSERSRLIVTYALCGFANFGSLGIMIGGLGAMVPSRKSEIIELGLRSLVAGTLATLMTGAVVSLIIIPLYTT